TLLVLIRHQGRLVSKDELMKEVWHDSFVEESNLTRHISILRKALNREGSTPCIETVPKRGYRFVGAVQKLVDEQAELIVQTSKVSVVIEAEENDRGINEQGDRSVLLDGESATGPEHGTAIRWKQNFKRHKFVVILTLLAIMAALAIAVSVFTHGN